MREALQMKHGEGDRIVKPAARRVSILGAVVMLVTHLLSGCGGGGSLRDVQGAKFALNAKETEIAEYGEKRQPPASDRRERCEFWEGVNQRTHAVAPGSSLAAWAHAKEVEACPCVLGLDAKLDGDAVVGHLNCGGRAVQAARLWLTCAGCDLVLPKSGVSATTSATGEARFDLSNMEVGRDFGRFNTKAAISFRGDFESGLTWRKGTDYSAPGIPLIDPNVEVRVDLTRASRYATWKAQAGATQQANTDTLAAERAKLDAECTQGDGDSCKKLGKSYSFSAIGSTGTDRQRDHATSIQYYRKACALTKDTLSCAEVDAVDNPAPAEPVPSVTRQITASNPFQSPVSVMPGQTITASFTTTQDNARLSCDFRTFGQTNQTRFDHSNGGQGKPCTVSVTNKGPLGLSIVLVVATNYVGHPITIKGDIRTQ